MSNINIDKGNDLPIEESKGAEFGDSLYTDSWLNLVFKNRNKAYGAYHLRRNYAKHIIIGFLISFALFGFATSLPFLFKKKKDRVKVIVMSKSLAEPKKLEKKKQELPPPPPVKPPEIKTIKVLPPKVVPTEEVKEDPPTNAEQKTTAIGPENKEGVEDPNASYAVEEPSDPAPPPPPPPEDKLELIVDEKPSYDGSHTEFFSINYQRPRMAQNAGIGGIFKVVLTIDREGRLVEKKVIDSKKVDLIDPKDPKSETYGIVKEIERVIDLMAKQGSFKPAKKGGKAVKAKLSFDINLTQAE